MFDAINQDLLPGTNVFISPDGLHWTGVSAPAPAGLLGISYGNGRFLAVGPDGSGITSADGKTWASHSPPTAPDFAYLAGVAFGADTFVAVGGFGIMYADSVIAGILQPWSTRIPSGTVPIHSRIPLLPICSDE